MAKTTIICKLMLKSPLLACIKTVFVYSAERFAKTRASKTALAECIQSRHSQRSKDDVDKSLLLHRVNKVEAFVKLNCPC